MLPYIPGSGGTGLGDFHPFMLIHLLSHRTKFPEPHHVWLCAGDGGGGTVVTRGIMHCLLSL